MTQKPDWNFAQYLDVKKEPMKQIERELGNGLFLLMCLCGNFNSQLHNEI